MGADVFISSCIASHMLVPLTLFTLTCCCVLIKKSFTTVKRSIETDDAFFQSKFQKRKSTPSPEVERCFQKTTYLQDVCNDCKKRNDFLQYISLQGFFKLICLSESAAICIQLNSLCVVVVYMYSTFLLLQRSIKALAP